MLTELVHEDKVSFHRPFVGGLFFACYQPLLLLMLDCMPGYKILQVILWYRDIDHRTEENQTSGMVASDLVCQ